MDSSHETALIAEYTGPQEPLPVVNPYAVIALVAALVLLFPVAIVFGLIAFTYPRGRGMAWSALILGCLQLGTLLSVLVIGSNAFNNASSALGESSTQRTTQATQLPVFIETTTLATSSTSEPAPTTTELPTTTVAPARPTSNSPCDESMKITTGADGNAMVCTRGGGAPRLVWQSTGKPLQPGIHDEGESCNPSTTTRFGQNSAGHVVECLNPDRQSGEGTTGEWTTKVNAS